MNQIRFRGGVKFTGFVWQAIVEINGQQYLSDKTFTTESAALAEYQRIRARILPALTKNPDLQVGPNLGGYTEVS